MGHPDEIRVSWGLPNWIFAHATAETLHRLRVVGRVVPAVPSPLFSFVGFDGYHFVGRTSETLAGEPPVRSLHAPRPRRP